MAHNLTQTDQYIPPELIGLTSVTPEQFEQLCIEYRDLRLELTSTKELIVVPGTGFQTGARNASLTYQLMAWTKKDGTGICCDSSTIFALPNGAHRSPDASWIKRDKMERLTERERERFGPFCPDFAVELRSPSDRLSPVRAKMVEYMENGASLGWLIDPSNRRVYIYEPNHEVVILENLEIVSGEPLLPGFKLNVSDLW